MEDEPAGRRRRVDIFGQGPETRAAILDRFHQVEQITQGSSKPVIFGGDHHITRAKLIKHLAEFGAISFRAADLVHENSLCTGRFQGVGLDIEVLIVCRDAGISNDHALS